MTKHSKQVRRIEAKIALKGWEWVDSKEMTYVEACREATEHIERMRSDFIPVIGVKISVLGKWWTEEFSGDADFNYIGIDI